MARDIVTPGRLQLAREVNRAALWRQLPFLSAALLVLALAGCQPRADTAQTEEAASPGGASASPAGTGAVASPDGDPASSTAAVATLATGQQARTRIAVERPSSSEPPPGGADRSPDAALAPGAAGKAPTELHASAAAPLMPEDFAIGPLQDAVAGPAPIRDAVEVIVGFLRGLADGQLAVDLVDQEVLADLRRSLGPELQQGPLPVAARVGAIEEDGDTAWARVRLFGTGRVDGEIYLVRRAKDWRVTDVQVDLRGLAVPYEAAGEPFFPASYRWLLIN